MPRPPIRVGIDAGRLTVFFHEPPGGLAVQVPPLQPGAVRPHRPEQGSLLVVPDARPLEVGAHRPRGVEQDLAPLLVPLLGDVEIMLNAIGLEVSHAGPDHRRDPASGQEKHAHQGQVAHPLQGVGRNRLQHRNGLPLGQGRCGVLLHAGGLDRTDVLGRLPGHQSLGRQFLVGAADDRQPPCHRGRGPAGFQQRPLVELDVVGGDLQRRDALRLHVPEEVHEVAAVGLDRMVRQERVADPGYERLGRTRAAGGSKRLGQEGFDLLGRRAVPLQEVAPLGQERGAAG